MKEYIVELIMEKLKLCKSDATFIYDDLIKTGQITDIKSALEYVNSLCTLTKQKYGG